MRSNTFNRRRFLQSSTAIAAGAILLPEQSWAAPSRGPDILVPRGGRWNDADPHVLATMAIDAARSAGASYADVRLTRTMVETWAEQATPTYPRQRQNLIGVGVRVLVNGFWGFMGSTRWTPDEMARLARNAVGQAKANSLGRTRELPLAATPPVVNGEWVMPVTYDPFTIPDGEKYDYMSYIGGVLHRMGPTLDASMRAKFTRTDKVFASSEGSMCRQTTYLTGGWFDVSYASQIGYKKPWPGATRSLGMSIAGRGWEQVTDPALLDEIPEMVELAERLRAKFPVDVGRYDLVCTPEVTATIANATIGVAAELDRAMGFEANAGGTSYLDKPLDMLGNFQIGSRLLNVRANRSQPGGAATVKWDDEGVVPDDITLVKDGVLTDYLTAREQAEWIAPYYRTMKRPVRSLGCVSTSDASQFPLIHPPNLHVMPGTSDANLDALVAGVTRGMLMVNVQQVLMDQQQLNGMIIADMCEINKGKLGRFVYGAALDFRAPELWKSLDAVGGPSSVRRVGMTSTKGEPSQLTVHSVSAVPVRFKEARIIDYTRKA